MNRYSLAGVQAIAAVPAAILAFFVAVGLLSSTESMPWMLILFAGVTLAACVVMVFLPVAIALHIIDVSGTAATVKPKKSTKQQSAAAAAAVEVAEVEEVEVEEAEVTDDNLEVFDEADADYGDAEEEIGELLEGLKDDDVQVVEGALTQQSLNAVQLDDADIVDDDDKTDELDILDDDEEEETDKK